MFDLRKVFAAVGRESVGGWTFVAFLTYAFVAKLSS